MIPEGSDAISPAPHHDIYSIEDLKQLVRSLKEATEWKKPVFVKIAAVHNVAAMLPGSPGHLPMQSSLTDSAAVPVRHQSFSGTMSVSR